MRKRWLNKFYKQMIISIKNDGQTKCYNHHKRICRMKIREQRTHKMEYTHETARQMCVNPKRQTGRKQQKKRNENKTRSRERANEQEWQKPAKITMCARTRAYFCALVTKPMSRTTRKRKDPNRFFRSSKKWEQPTFFLLWLNSISLSCRSLVRWCVFCFVRAFVFVWHSVLMFYIGF